MININVTRSVLEGCNIRLSIYHIEVGRRLSLIMHVIVQCISPGATAHLGIHFVEFPEATRTRQFIHSSIDVRCPLFVDRRSIYTCNRNIIVPVTVCSTKVDRMKWRPNHVLNISYVARGIYGLPIHVHLNFVIIVWFKPLSFIVSGNYWSLISDQAIKISGNLLCFLRYLKKKNFSFGHLCLYVIFDIFQYGHTSKINHMWPYMKTGHTLPFCENCPIILKIVRTMPCMKIAHICLYVAI